jgi:hypothetical protein
MIVPSQLALKNHTNFRCIASLATLDKLVDRFPLPPVAPPIGDTSLTHVMRLAAQFNYVTDAYCDGTLIYNDPIHTELFTNNNGTYKRNRLYIFRVCRSRIRCSLIRIKPKKPPNKPHGAYKPWFLFEHSKFLG